MDGATWKSLLLRPLRWESLVSEHEFTPDWDTFWEQDARTDRDEWDAHVRAWDEDERDRLTRDEGERAA